jgi:uncharacterized protein YjiS (DUF1127 family)
MRPQVYYHPSLLEDCRYLPLAERFRNRVREWRQRVRERNEVMMLSDRDLRDIRWNRYEAQVEARKPFWQA